MSKQEKLRLIFALLFCLIGVADLVLSVIQLHFNLFRAALGILLLLAGAMSARKVLNERTNAPN